MRYMLLMNYADAPGVPPLSEWAPEDARARGEAMMAIDRELRTSGEPVGAEGLTGPEAAKIVTHDGVGGPVVSLSRAGGPASASTAWAIAFSFACGDAWATSHSTARSTHPRM
jgi:hypothetical protein